MRITCHVLALALLALGCEARVSLGGRCENDADCPGTFVCRFDRCRAQCERAEDCREPGAICIGPTGRGACSVPSVDTCANDCGDGLVCAGETCAVPCVPSGDDCLEGSTCGVLSGIDVCVAAPTDDAGTEDAGATDAPLDAAPRPDADRDAGMIAPSARRTLCLGENYACATHGGVVHCWGSNEHGELGDGTSDASGSTHTSCGVDCAPRPVPVLTADGTSLGEASPIVELSCGQAHTCAVDARGDVYCWGDGSTDVLGRSGNGHRALQVGGLAEITAIVSGRYHTCVRREPDWWCWGQNGVSMDLVDDRVGTGTTDEFQVARPAISPSFADLPALAMGNHFTCGIRPEGDVFCQGDNETGAIGSETFDGPIPRGAVIAGTTGAASLEAAVVSACMLTAAGALACWGGNDHGELATNDVNDCTGVLHGRCRGSAAVAPDPSGRRFARLSRGLSEHLCAITTDGEIACWGLNHLGQAGEASLANLYAPGPPVSDVMGPLTEMVEVATGAGSTCARDVDGRVYCWGANDRAQLGCTAAADGAAHPTACEVVFP